MGIQSLRRVLWTAVLPLAVAASAPAAAAPSLEETIVELGHTHLTDGNRVAILDVPEVALSRRLDLIRSARHHLLISTFQWNLDPFGSAVLDAVKEAIALRRDEGSKLTVLVLVDYTTPGLSQDHLHRVCRQLERAGAKVRHFNPPSWGLAPLYTARLHDKMVVADGRRAVFGGRNLNWKYFDPAIAWYDADVEVEGPAVQELQMHFLKAWVTGRHSVSLWNLLRPPAAVRSDLRKLWATGRLPDGSSPLEPFITREFFPPVEPRPEGVRAAVLYDNPLVWDRAPTQDLVEELVRRARAAVDIASPFPTFPVELTEALVDAHLRGVEVRVLVNSREAQVREGLLWQAQLPTLIRLVEAGVGVWGWLGNEPILAAAREAGCRVYELPGSSLHAKLLRVDDEVAVVHSSNFNYRSAHFNTEAGLLALDRGLARELEDRVDAAIAPGPRPVPCVGAAGAERVDGGPLAVRLTVDDLERMKQELGDRGPTLDSLSVLW